ncbi:MAG: site-specific integrase, partial [Clostridiales bacterium]|nr:site-specific integrase [Clostridiales bacterium]
MKANNNDFATFLSDFFQKYLPGHRGLSVNTIKSYRDTFVVFFRFLSEKEHIKPEKLNFHDMDRTMIERFTGWLEHEKRNSVPTRNQRLAAVHAFMKYVMTHYPEYFEQCRQVIDIPSKKTAVKPPIYLSIEELKLIFQQPDQSTTQGIRDLALLTLLYDSGYRVQELIDLTWIDLRFEKPATLTLTGKGNKTRIVPLMPDTAGIMSLYARSKTITNRSENVFLNQSNEKLSRSGVEYIINKYAKMAGNIKPSIKEKRITPHVYRHSKGMHLTQADVNIIYIRDLLGHSSVQVTERY